MRIAVVHLARRQNPPEAFERFWQSYVGHEPGAGHDLVMVWKNYVGVDHPVLPGRPAFAHDIRHIVLSDQGFDIDAYFAVAGMLDHDAFVFLNSWSAINRDGWLAALRDALREKVGLVGASSSRESHRDNIAAKLRDDWKAYPPLKKPLALLEGGYRWLRYGLQTPANPNFHVRTNGFMIRREVMALVHKPVLRDKLDAFKFESGRRGLTRQVEGLGYEVAALDDLRLILDNRVR